MANDNKPSFQERIAQWMTGRNGTDELAMACVWLALILYIVALVSRVVFINFVSLALLVYAWLRMTSRSVEARRRENYLFLSKIGPLGPWLRNPVAAFQEARAYKHFKCPECGQRMRVPRRRGRLRVRCPKCQHRFEMKS